MNRQQAAMVMSHIGSIHPQVVVSPDMLESWYSADLISVDFDLGMQVAEFIIREDQRFPTPARFREVRRAMQRSAEPERREVGEGCVSDEEGREWVRRVRETVAASRARAGVPDVPGMRSVGQTMTETAF